MRRAEHRRNRRAAAAARLTPAQLIAWQTGRQLPADHPDKAAEIRFSTRELGFRCIDVVERAKVLTHLIPRFSGRRGRKRGLGIKAFLVCVLIAAYIGRSYRRTDLVAVLYGLHPDVASALGLLDANGHMHPTITYNVVIKTANRLERLLRRGFRSGLTRCNLEWFAHRMIRASVPRDIRRSVRAAIVDSTPVPTWARTRNFGKQSTLDKDAYALHRKLVVDNPQLNDPESRREALAAAARKQGLPVGDDGRIIRGKDPDARAGYATGTAKRPAHFYTGYELTLVVACRSIAWQGHPDACKLGPCVPNYVLAMAFEPAGTNPGPIGRRAVMWARRVAPNIKDVIADRAYTVKRESFVRGLHKRRINVTMDHPRPMITRPDAAALGKRRQPVISHCGTFLPDWTPTNNVVPPANLRRKGNEAALEAWYNKRYERRAWRPAGPVKKSRKKAAPSTRQRRKRRARGVRRFQCPVCANHAAIPNKATRSYAMPLVAGPPGGGPCCGGKVNALLEDLDQHQAHPYGTTVWKTSYARRPTVEAVIGKIKANSALGNAACQALGLAANTIAAIAAVVAYNLKLSRTNGHSQTNPCARPANNGGGNPASDSNGNPATTDSGNQQGPDADGDIPHLAPP